MKKRFWIIALIVLAALGGGGYYYYTTVIVKNAAAQKVTYQTTKVVPGTLIASVGSNGTVRPRQSANVNWKTSGTVSTIEVKVGDKVQAGQVLGTLTSDSADQSLLQSQNDLLSAKIALDNLYKNADVNKSQAMSDLVAAQQEFDNATRNRAIYSRKTVGSQDAIDSYYATYILAKQSQTNAQESFNAVSNKAADDPAYASALQNLVNANNKVTSAWFNYSYYQSPPNQKDITVSDARLALAKSKLDAAKANVDSLKDGPSANDVLQAQNKITLIENTIAQTKENLTLTAPFSGTVTDINTMVGDQAASSSSTTTTAAFRLDDLSTFYVDVSVSEVDIDRVQVGQDVNLTFDAILGTTYHGKVDEISPVGVSSSGATNFTVTAKMTDGDDHIKIGLTAAADLLVTKLDNIITVPSSSVQMVNNNQVVYTLAADGITAQRVQVTIGATSDTDSQILEGLKEGDLLILNPPSSTTASSSARGGFGIPFIGGGGGGGGGGAPPRD